MKRWFLADANGQPVDLDCLQVSYADIQDLNGFDNTYEDPEELRSDIECTFDDLMCYDFR